MKVGERYFRTIWVADDGRSVEIIDQTLLPHRFATVRLRSLEDAARAIRTMQVRGAPLIGATAAYGVCLVLAQDLRWRVGRCLRDVGGDPADVPLIVASMSRRTVASLRDAMMGSTGDAIRALLLALDSGSRRIRSFGPGG